MIDSTQKKYPNMLEDASHLKHGGLTKVRTFD